MKFSITQMKTLSMTLCAAVCCMGNPAMALTPPVCFDCSLQESMRLNNQYFEMQRIEQRQQEQQQQIDRFERQQRWNRYRNY